MHDNKIEDILNAQSGSQSSMTKLMNDNSNLIWSIVRRFKDRGYDIEDLYQIGCIGFIKAIKRFDSNYEVKLSTYAVPYILGEIKRFIRDDGPIKVSRTIKELTYKIRIIQEDYLAKNGNQISIEELVKILKVSKEDIIVALDSINCVDSIEKSISENEDLSIIDRISSEKDEEKEIINKIVVNGLINELEEKEKQLIILRYYRAQTQVQVSEIMGISQVQISRLEKKILNNMKQKLLK